MLSDEKLWRIARKCGPITWYSGDFLKSWSIAYGRSVAEAAAQAERHRIYAALEADPGALWRDQGFQEWRSKRNGEVM